MSVEIVKTRISPDLLDTIGKSFKFRHGSGISEWLKNALDNYLRLRKLSLESRGGSWPVIVDLIDGTSTSNGPSLAVIDFGGTSLSDIEDFFLEWGSRSAAKLGGRVDVAALTGGHGNGGKFYMREMWRSGARFATYSEGRATSLVVERRSDGNTGYWEFKDRAMAWREACRAALPIEKQPGDGDKLIAYLETHEPELVSELDAGNRGLTLVVGRRAVQVLSSNDVVRGGRWDHQRLVDSIREAPQARRPIRELAISVFKNGVRVVERLTPEAVGEDPDWPPVEIAMPKAVIPDVRPAADPSGLGQLRLAKAGVPLTGRLRHRNAVAILDEHGNPIASYSIREIPLPGHSPVLDFVHGELDLEFRGVEDLVQNDREKLVPSPATQAILEWVGERVWERAGLIDKTQREASRKTDLELASILNDSLNQHAKRFLEELQTQIYVDVVEDPEGGGPGPRGGTGSGDGGTGTGGEGAGGVKEVPGSSEQVRRPRFPQVLLSDYDPDPSTGGVDTKHLTDRHPPLDQDDVDKRHNVWWINTQHVFARAALERAGPKGPAFRSYQLHMFRDVVQRESLRYRQRREAELSLDRVENELTDVSNRFLAELPHDLVNDLLS